MTDTTKAERPLPPSWPLIAVAFGAAIGLLVHLALEQDFALVWEFGLVQTVLTLGLALVLTGGPGDLRTPTVFALALAGLSVLLSVFAILRFGSDLAERDYTVARSLAVQSVLFGFLVITGFQAWHEREAEGWVAKGRRGSLMALRYASVFNHLWDNVLVAAVGGCFIGLFWLLLVLFANLFDSVGVSWFDDLIQEAWFGWPATCGAAALAVVFLRYQDRMFSGLRAIVLTLFAALAPVFLALSGVFLVVLLAGGFERMASLVSASATLLVLTGFGLVFVNSVVRTGDEAQESARPLRLSAVLLLPCLVVFCAFAAYAIGLRIGQHGLTPDRVIVAATTGVVSLWCLAYLASLLARRDWTSWVRRTNVAMIALVAGTIALLQSPLADPYRLSAENQYNRLVEGLVSAREFDYGFLKFQLGLEGRAVLASLQEDAGEADGPVVAERLAELSQADDRRGLRKVQREKASRVLADPRLVQRVPESLDLPEDLLAQHWTFLSLTMQRCGEGNDLKCAITAIDITDQPGLEYLFLFGYDVVRFNLVLIERRPDGTGWRAHELPTAYEAGGLWTAFMNGELDTAPAGHRDLRYGDHFFRLYRPNLLHSDD